MGPFTYTCKGTLMQKILSWNFSGPPSDFKKFQAAFAMKIMSQPHRKAYGKLNFYWKICGHLFQGPPPLTRVKNFKGPHPFCISPPYKWLWMVPKYAPGPYLIRGGTQLSSGWGVRPGFPKCGACELILASEKGGLWTKNFQIWGLVN